MVATKTSGFTAALALANGTPAFAAPLLQHDIVTSLLVDWVTANTVNAADSATLEVYASRTRPKDATEARMGDAVVPPVDVIAAVTGVLSNIVGGTTDVSQYFVHGQLTIPLHFRPGQDRRYLTVILTSNGTAISGGCAFIGITRQLRDIPPDQRPM